MTSTGMTALVLGALVLITLSWGQGRTAEHGKSACVGVSRASTISAEGPAYDVPGGAKIGYAFSGTDYMSVAFVRQADGEQWVLLVGPGGKWAGWIKRADVRHTTLPVLRCPAEILYARPQ
jgi:hypothetical protein